MNFKYEECNSSYMGFFPFFLPPVEFMGVVLYSPFSLQLISDYFAPRKKRNKGFGSARIEYLKVCAGKYFLVFTILCSGRTWQSWFHFFQFLPTWSLPNVTHVATTLRCQKFCREPLTPLLACDDLISLLNSSFVVKNLPSTQADSFLLFWLNYSMILLIH